MSHTALKMIPQSYNHKNNCKDEVEKLCSDIKKVWQLLLNENTDTGEHPSALPPQKHNCTVKSVHAKSNSRVTCEYK